MGSGQRKRHDGQMGTRSSPPVVAEALPSESGTFRAREARHSYLPRSALPMWIFDAASGAILAVNDQALKAYGYEREELLQCSVHEICPGDARTLMEQAVRDDAPWTGTIRVRRKDGHSFEADVSMIETGSAAHSAKMVIAVATRSSGEVAPNERPRGAARSKTLLGDAPDIRALLDSEGLMGFPLRRVELGAALHALSLDAFAAVAARELLAQVRERVLPRANSKNVDVVVYCTCGRVWVQPEALSQALFELLDNAIKAAKRGRPVVVDVRDTKDGDTFWQVHDVGVGVSDRALAELGKPCCQLGRAPRLGVAFAWAVIDAHGGLLHYESARDVGTTVSLWLPRKYD